MRVAYADPPYFGCGHLYKNNHDDWSKYDDLDAWRELLDRLDGYDGWALSMTSGNLHDLLPLCPRDARIGAWTKPFASFKPNVNPGYTWEPVVYKSGRRRDRSELTVRDYCAVNITLKKGLTGAKPEGFCEWVLDLLGWRPGDVLDDLFPGTGVMGRVVAARGATLEVAA